MVSRPLPPCNKHLQSSTRESGAQPGLQTAENPDYLAICMAIHLAIFVSHAHCHWPRTPATGYPSSWTRASTQCGGDATPPTRDHAPRWTRTLRRVAQPGRSTTSKVNSITAVLASMAVAEQYFS